ncbi:MAG: NAD(P)H-dependent oxidoreductase [Thermaerobacter sp.]|nr:NAD(P)H-dependent oxidoreductase [Thermaerobacter sp.]
MERKLHIIGISGSLRKASFNRMLLRAAGELMPAEAELEILEIGDLPYYNQDVDEAGAPPVVQEFRDKVRAADALLFAVPEYNYSLTGVLKNAIDWASRPVATSALRGKPTAVMGASGGAFGTVRAQLHFRQVAVFCDMHMVNKPEIMVREPSRKFGPNGRLDDEETQQLVRQLLVSLVEWTQVLQHGRAYVSR